MQTTTSSTGVHETHHGHDPHVDKKLTIIISSADEDHEFTFARETKISDVILAAVKEFKLDPNDAYDLFLPKHGGHKNPPLEKDRTLGSYHEIHDGTKLTLTSRGGGV